MRKSGGYKMTNEAKLKELLTRMEDVNAELDFMLKHTARIAAWHQSAKGEVKTLREVKEELMERIKKLEVVVKDE
jgi:peptidoglycan hydrolase CwlO-like protein